MAGGGAGGGALKGQVQYSNILKANNFVKTLSKDKPRGADDGDGGGLDLCTVCKEIDCGFHHTSSE